ncbi:hypothetical protein PC116_g28659 [Phytophthora cactorum]|nr:hypothetical protein PC116_g28659 [Phytophthora cactorum]
MAEAPPGQKRKREAPPREIQRRRHVRGDSQQSGRRCGVQERSRWRKGKYYLLGESPSYVLVIFHEDRTPSQRRITFLLLLCRGKLLKR